MELPTIGQAISSFIESDIFVGIYPPFKVNPLSVFASFTAAQAMKKPIILVVKKGEEIPEWVVAISNVTIVDDGNFDVQTAIQEAVKKLVKDVNLLESQEDCSPALPPKIEMNDDVFAILSKPCFECGRLAEALRYGGHDIRRRAESEQSYVLLWMLNIYLEHKEGWSNVASEELNRCVVLAQASRAEKESKEGSR